jgi:Ca2+-dependent lipid-binding protein
MTFTSSHSQKTVIHIPVMIVAISGIWKTRIKSALIKKHAWVKPVERQTTTINELSSLVSPIGLQAEIG